MLISMHPFFIRVLVILTLIRDIHKIEKLSQLIHCELVGFFVSLDVPSVFEFGDLKQGNLISTLWQIYEEFLK